MPYKLCPRCELNYIPEDEEYCGVCKAELKIGPQLMFAIDDEDESSEKLCPVCKRVYIPIGEEMCDSCKEKSLYTSDTVDDEKDDSWRAFLDEEKDEISKDGDEDIISLSEIEKEEAQFEDDEEDEDEFAEQEVEEEPDDFEYLPVDEKDFEDTDEEEEEDEDDEDDF